MCVERKEMSRLKESRVSIEDIRAAQKAGVSLQEIRSFVLDPETDVLGLAVAILEMGRVSRGAEIDVLPTEETQPNLTFGA